MKTVVKVGVALAMSALIAGPAIARPSYFGSNHQFKKQTAPQEQQERTGFFQGKNVGLPHVAPVGSAKLDEGAIDVGRHHFVTHDR